MYWLLDYDMQEIVRNKIIKLQSNIINTPVSRNQCEQVFPFDGRKDRQRFFVKKTDLDKTSGGDYRVCLREIKPSNFEKLIAKYFEARGYGNPQVIGQANDRGVDVLVTNPNGELELVQCKRYRTGNNIGSAVIQRIDSYMRTRHAARAWVVTTSDFTPEGKDEARITGVCTINGQELIKSLELYFPGKYML